MSKRGHNITVAAPIGSKVPDGVTLIETVNLPSEQDQDQIALDRLAKQTDLTKFDIIHDFSHGQIIGQYVNLPYIAHLWDPVVTRYNKSKYNMLCVSVWQKERFEHVYGQKARLMPPWVDTNYYKPLANPTRERFLFIGKMTREKGAILALDFAKELNVPLDLVGGLIATDSKDYYNNIELQAQKAREEGHDINVLYNATEEQKLQLLQNAKAVIYPVQQEEAHWLVGMESWACNVPTIVLDKGSMNEIHSEPRYNPVHTRVVQAAGTSHEIQERVGYVCPSQEAFKDAMRRVDGTKWGCREFAVEWYSLENVIPQYEELYSRVRDGERW